jgi:hypothetical protein
MWGGWLTDALADVVEREGEGHGGEDVELGVGVVAMRYG